MHILLPMIYVMPFEFSPYLLLSANFLGGFTVIKLLGLFGLAWVVFEVASGQVSLRLKEVPQVQVFSLFVITVLFSSVVGGAGFRAAMQLLSTLSFLPLVLTAVRREQDLWRALKTCVFVMILLLPYGYRQMMRFGGRFGVGLNEANYVALVLVLLLPLPFIFARCETDGQKKALWCIGGMILLFEIVLTGSRGGFLGALVVMLLMIMMFLKRRILALSSLVVIVVFLLFVIPSTLSDRLRASGLDSGVKNVAAESSAKLRLDLLKAGLRMIQANPIIGIGLGKFENRAKEYGAKAEKIAHNTYIEVAAELGLPALGAFLAMYWVTFASLARTRQRSLSVGRRDLAELATGIRIGLVGFAFSSAFLSAQFENFFWLIVFLSICFERIVHSIGQSKEIDNTSRKLPERPFLRRPPRAREVASA